MGTRDSLSQVVGSIEVSPQVGLVISGSIGLM